MKRLIKFIIAVSILSSFWACDKIETPYKDGVETTTPEVTDRTKRILLEDYTGHTCGTCPPAAQTASSLLSTFGDKVVMMGVHAGWFAKPKTGDQYTTDFRTEQSEAFYEYFQINTNPIGLINR